MPKHRQLLRLSKLRFVRVGQADEVEDERIHDFVGKRVFLIQQYTNEEGVRSCEDWLAICGGISRGYGSPEYSMLARRMRAAEE